MSETNSIPKWIRWLSFGNSLFMMALFGWLSLESYRLENWQSLGNAGAWFFMGCWIFFAVSSLPDSTHQKDTRFITVESSETANRVYPTGQYVYLIQDVTVTGYFKIGKTNNPSRRMYDFGVLLPMQVKVIHVIPCQNMSQLEAQLHRQFADKRVNGEWFALSQPDIDYIKGL